MADRLEELIENNKRNELNAIAEKAGIEDPQDYPNKKALALAIIEAEKPAETPAETPTAEPEQEPIEKEETSSKPKKAPAKPKEIKRKVKDHQFEDDEQNKLNNLKTFYDAFKEFPVKTPIDPLMAPLAGRVRQLCKERNLIYSRDLLIVFIQQWANVLIVD